MIYVCYSPWHFCLYLQWKLVCIDGIICHRLVYNANYLTFSQTAFLCCQRKASMSDSFLQTTRCCSPSGWDLANVNAHQSFRCHMPPAGLMERRPAEDWNWWRRFMSSGEDISNIRVLNSTLRTYNWLVFFSSTGHQWKQEVDYQTKDESGARKMFSALSEKQRAAQPLRTCDIEAVIWEQKRVKIYQEQSSRRGHAVAVFS